MAIEKAIFTASGSDRATEIATWLQANATEYFDTIELQENGYEIKCNIDEVTVLDIQVTHSNYGAVCSVTLINGTSQTTSTSNIIGAYKTSNGVCLYMEGATTTSRTDPTTGELYYQYSGGRDILICKSNKGNTSFAFNIDSSYSGGGNLSTADVSSDSRFSKWIIGTDTTYDQIGKRPLTVLSPLPLGDGGTVAQGVYFTPFSQYRGINNPITLYANGKNYVYDGDFALEE